MSVETIARRYGTALADVVLKTGEAEAVKGELKQWEAVFTSSADLQDAFANPSIAFADKEKVLESLIERTKPLRTSGNFLRVLLKNGRIGELAAINERFAAVLDERNGIEAAFVTSARELNDGQKNEMKANLEKLTGNSIVLSFDIDTELIGGVVARVGSTVYDSSVRTQLENLREELVNG